MTSLLCRITVADYEAWRNVFDDDAEAHREAGMTLRRLWRTKDDPKLIYLLFDVNSVGEAQAFMDAPSADDHTVRSGVISAEYHFVENDETAKSTLGFSMELP